MKDMKKYNGYDELSDRKQMQHWAGSKKFHDDNDKSIAELEKEKEEKEKRKAKDFKSTAPCYMKPSNTKTTKKKVNENSVVKLNESQLRKIVAESVKKVLKEGYYDPDFRGPNDTDRLAGDILDFIDKNIEKYQNANRYEAVKQVLDACNPKNNITYGHEDDIDQGHTFGY